jgi:uncharacterized protein YlxW (UPF0749 family)
MTFQLRANSILVGLPYDQGEQLTMEFNNLTKQNASLEAEANDLENKIRLARAGQGGAVEAAESELKKTDLEAGLTTVAGPGVQITLNNVTAQAVNGTNVYIIRDEDLLKLINELDAAGAEAVSINGERIITTSEVRLAGSNIDVNLMPITPPYVVLAIGDADQLTASLQVPGGVLSFLQDLGISVTVKKEAKIVVPGFKGNPYLSYAREVQPSSPAKAGG